MGSVKRMLIFIYLFIFHYQSILSFLHAIIIEKLIDLKRWADITLRRARSSI